MFMSLQLLVLYRLLRNQSSLHCHNKYSYQYCRAVLERMRRRHHQPARRCSRADPHC